MIFAFEQDFVATWRCIPMVVRYRLDTCGIKLKLSHWQALDLHQRQWLVDTPCDTLAQQKQYADQLQAWVTEKTGQPAGTITVSPLWLNTQELPPDLQDQLTLTEWQGLTPLQRFALVKLSRPGHEHRNLPQALREFGVGNRI
ncbi:MAG: nitrate reductase associated protein [Gloeomargarita sp. HHBFW_bins_162]